jgi:predicted DNA-binding protein (MmcQ/YjbR family)
MDFLSTQKYIASKHQAKEMFPSGPDVAVYKVCHKMFATLTAEGGTPRVSLKCDPELALQLREQYPAVHPGFQMNKKHWNTILLDQSIPDVQIQRMIDHSYQLIVDNLPTLEREQLLTAKA